MNKRGGYLLALLAFLGSGGAGLAYEIVWTKWFAIGLGHEMPSLLSVVAAFFGGFAVGAWVLDTPISRSARPGRWYAMLELGVAAWALILAFALPVLNDFLPHWIGADPSPIRHWSIAFLTPTLTLLPATIAMGGTLPAMDRLVARLRKDGHTVAGLYAINTLGALLGTLAAVHLLLPAVGSFASLWILAGVNVLCAAAIMLGPARNEAARVDVTEEKPDRPGDLRLGLTIFLTGLFGIAYEVLGIRVMAQVLENTVFSFASALVMYLVGTVIGAALYQRFGRNRPHRIVLAWLLQLTCISCLIGVWILSRSGAIYEAARDTLGGGFFGSVGAEMVLGGMAFLIPATIMGATFSHLAMTARRTHGGVGWTLGLNTLGGALAPLLFGVILLPLIGARHAIVAAAIGYLLLLPRVPTRHYAPGILAVILPIALPPSLVLVEPLPGGRMLEYREGVLASVAVVSGEPMLATGALPTGTQGVRTLKVNNRFRMGGTGLAFEERRQGHIPMLMHAGPRRALFLGVGTGNTLGAAMMHPDVTLTGVELLPEVIELLPEFAETNFEVYRAGNVTLVPGDARRFVRATDDTYDVIVADLFHPARDGSGLLYTREHFAAIRQRLADDGLFCQWLPLYQVDTDVLRTIVRSFLDVYPNASGWVGAFNTHTPILGLIGTRNAGTVPQEPIDQRLQNDRLRDHLERADLDSEIKLRGCRLGDADWLRAFAGEGPLNVDDHPIVVYQAPRFVYEQETRASYGRLRDLISRTPDLPRPDETPAITAYRSARDRYLEGAMAMADGDPASALNACIDSAALSTDFKLGYLVGLNMIQQNASQDPAGARVLVQRLIEAHPDDPRARDLLRRLPR